MDGQKASAKPKLENNKAKGYSTMGVSLSAGQHVSEKSRSPALVHRRRYKIGIIIKNLKDENKYILI